MTIPEASQLVLQAAAMGQGVIGSVTDQMMAQFAQNRGDRSYPDARSSGARVECINDAEDFHG